MRIIDRLAVVHSDGAGTCGLARQASRKVSVSELQLLVFKFGFCAMCSFTTSELEVRRKLNGHMAYVGM